MDPHTQISQPNKYKLLLICMIIAIIGIVIGVLVYMYAFVEIRIASSGDAPSSVTLRQSGKERSFETRNSTVKRLVRRGQYEISIRQDDKSFVAAASVGGFLGATAIDAELAPQKQREFIGNNPGGCADLVEGVLLSYGCRSVLSNLYLHVPASGTLATYTKRFDGAIQGTIQGLVHVQNQDAIIIRALPGEHDQVPIGLYATDKDMNLRLLRALEELNPDISYNIIPTNNGFFAVSADYKDAFYYNSASTSGKKINLQNQPDNFTPYTASALNETLAIIFAENAKQEVNLDDADAGKTQQTQVNLYDQDNDTQTIKLPVRYNTVVLCGQHLLCGLTQGTLDILDATNKDSVKKTGQLYGVSSITMSGSDLLVTKQKEVIRFNAGERKGYIDYGSGDYQTCGLWTTKTSYLVCVIDARQNKSVLSISPDAPLTQPVDRQIAELLRQESITNISVYKNRVFITPDFGSRTYSTVQKRFVYNDATKKQVT